jgi:hypothetical protein
MGLSTSVGMYVALLQPHGSLLAVDGWVWERHWNLLMEVGGGWDQRERSKGEMGGSSVDGGDMGR